MAQKPSRSGKTPPEIALYVRSLGGDKTRGILQAGNLRLPCALGRGGISAFKREGDFAAPKAKLRLIGGFRQNSARILPRCGVKLRRIHPQDGWCDAPQDANYNRPVRLPYHSSAESLCRADSLYNIGFITDWNWRKRVKGRGSAIFLHIARPIHMQATEALAALPAKTNGSSSHAAKLFRPTAGCIAVSEASMRRLMPLLRQGAAIAILG